MGLNYLIKILKKRWRISNSETVFIFLPCGYIYIYIFIIYIHIYIIYLYIPISYIYIDIFVSPKFPVIQQYNTTKTGSLEIFQVSICLIAVYNFWKKNTKNLIGMLYCYIIYIICVYVYIYILYIYYIYISYIRSLLFKLQKVF